MPEIVVELLMTLHEPAGTTVEGGSHLSKYTRCVPVDFLNAECVCITLCIKMCPSGIRRGNPEAENWRGLLSLVMMYHVVPCHVVTPEDQEGEAL